MNEQSEGEEKSAEAGSQEEVVFLLKKLREQLTFLERKVDLLTAQLKEREKAPSFNKERTYSKPPFRSSAPYNSQRGESRYESRPERSGPPRERSYDTGNRGAKPYSGGNDSRSYAGKKKPFFSKNRER